MNIPLFCCCWGFCLFVVVFCAYSGEIIDMFSDLRKKSEREREKPFNVGFLADTVQGRSFKLCMIITFLWI